MIYNIIRTFASFKESEHVCKCRVLYARQKCPHWKTFFLSATMITSVKHVERKKTGLAKKK